MSNLISFVDRLKSLDLKNEKIENILKIIESIETQFFTTSKLLKGTRIFRARIWNEVSRIPTNITELSCNPLPSKSFGRVHCIGDSIFYASTELEESKVPHYFNTILETLEDMNKERKWSKYFVVSSWILNVDLPLVYIGSNLTHAENFNCVELPLLIQLKI